MLIDLHAHSTASDGTDTPAELMAAAAAAGLDVVAITDHDNTAGWQPALDARPDGLTVIRGAEFSTLARTDSWPVSVHLLGYLFDPAHAAIVTEQARLREERLQRGMAIVAKMVAAGIPITAEQVMAIAERRAGRPAAHRPGPGRCRRRHLGGPGFWLLPLGPRALLRPQGRHRSADRHRDDRRGRWGQRHRAPAEAGASTGR